MQIRELIDLDFTAMLVVRSLLPAMKKRRAGRTCYWDRKPRSAALKRAPYTALPNLRCAALRKHSAKTARNGIAVTLVNPGMVRTPFFDKLSQPQWGRFVRG